MDTHISLGFLQSHPRAAARARALVERGLDSYHQGRTAEASALLARLLMFCPVGHPTRAAIISALETLRSGRAA